MNKLLAIAAAALVAASSVAFGQGTPVVPLVANRAVSATNPMPVTGSLSASLGGFTPSAFGARGTPLTVTTSDSTGTLPTGTVVIVSNVGITNPMYCNVNNAAATVGDQLITANGGWFAFTIPAAITSLRCIATGGSTTANMLGGSGLATGTGGGSGGSGGGGAITMASGAVSSGAYSSGSIASGAYASGSIASGAMVDLGAQADSACATDNGTCSEIALTKRTNQRLTTLNTTLGSPFQAGGSIGNTTFAVTQATSSSLKAQVDPLTAASWAIGATAAAVPANAGYIGLSDGTNLRGWLGAANALNSTGAGLGTAQVIGQFDDTSPTSITENQFGNLRMSANRNLYGTIRDAAGNERGVNVTASNELLVNVNNTNANGQATMANSSPVVIASNQSNIPINTAQINGVTVLTGTGATGTGAQRVTVSTDQATNAGAALVKGGVGVVNGGSTYQAVAASSTATVLQTSTGAAGDYLSHCDIYPTSTSPGVVTVFDNTNTAATSVILFPGGASSLSNLVPFPVPVGAVSTAGAWKVTTGSAVSVVCYGKFSFNLLAVLETVG